ncbi:MAG TPA: hypothetical protein VFY14_10245 [Streptomyces sp.]|nr:hypothetical protein [Streptomyces sp.]
MSDDSADDDTSVARLVGDHAACRHGQAGENHVSGLLPLRCRCGCHRDRREGADRR